MTQPGAGPDNHAPLRLRDLPDVPVPAVPWSSGARMIVVLSFFLGLLGLGFLGLTFMSAAPLAQIVGAADTSTAVVTTKTFKKGGFGRYSSNCDFYRFNVAWDDREGLFTVCSNPDFPITRLKVGDEVVIRSVPWASEVTPEGNEGDRFWSVSGLLAGLWLVWLAAAWTLRYRRLIRGGSTGVRLSGRLIECSANSMSVRLNTPGLQNQRLVMLPAGKLDQVAKGELVEIWASRRSILLRRPRGPWVAKVHRTDIVFTHAWLRAAKSADRPG